MPQRRLGAVEPAGVDLLGPGLPLEIGGGNLRADARDAVVEGGKPQPVMLKVGASDGSSTEISGRDIKEGDLIISGERSAAETK